MVVLDLGEFEYTQEQFLHYIVHIRDTDNFEKVFAKIEEWHSAESIIIYYDCADASTLEAKFIASAIIALRPNIKRIEIIPINETGLNETMDEDVDDALGDDVNEDFAIYLKKVFGSHDTLFITKVQKVEFKMARTLTRQPTEPNELDASYGYFGRMSFLS